MDWCVPAIGEYAVFWAVDRVCKYYVDKDYDKRYQIWRSEFEILVLLIIAWSAWFRAVPWIFSFLTLLTWLASVPNDGQKILFEGRLLLLGPVIRKSFNNTLRHYRSLRDGLPGACDKASLIEKIVFSICLIVRRIGDVAHSLRLPITSTLDRIVLYWRDMMDNYRNMEAETPHQSFAATHNKSVSFDASPTVFMFSPPQMSSTPNNNGVASHEMKPRGGHIHAGNNRSSAVTPVGVAPRRTSLRRQAKAANSAGSRNS